MVDRRGRESFIGEAAYQVVHRWPKTNPDPFYFKSVLAPTREVAPSRPTCLTGPCLLLTIGVDALDGSG